ncbi:MAG: UDP-3-O-(3-hydroxymyristoyl)glucosamine N-acyltransferase [Gammaproteobacteria bacterium]|nr:UDP-3-O-(3-hydroxymyristoyl)glucosamine N-acyltransferase [Gammaproteobacteria bacterium]
MSSDTHSLNSILQSLAVARDAVRGTWHGEIAAPVALDADNGAGGIAFCNHGGERAFEAISRSKANVILCHRFVVAQIRPPGPSDRVLIAVDEPRLAFSRLVNSLWPQPYGDVEAVESDTHSRHVHRHALVSQSAWLGPGVVVDAHVRIGPDCRLESGVRLHRGVLLGQRVRVGANSVLGDAGFGFVRDHRGHLESFPQRAGLRVGDDVDIGANVCINRGALTDTVIGEGTKIDDLAYIAHNVVIGAHCLIMASTVVAGSARVGDFAEISPGARIRDHVSVGQRARVGLGAVVVSDVEPGTIVAGVPAKPFKKS